MSSKEYNKQYYEKNKDRLNAANRRRYNENIETRRKYAKDKYHAQKNAAEWKKRKEYRKEWAANWNKQLRLDIFAHYGRSCTCPKCPEFGNEDIDIRFLTLDHINNDGAEHRKKTNRRGIQMYKVLRDLGFPTGFRTLCWNCNCARQLNNGICPHDDPSNLGSS